MTKKDYVLIAGVLRDCRPPEFAECERSGTYSCGDCEACFTHTGKQITHAQICTNIGNALAQENPLFSMDKFIAEVNK